MVQKISRDIPLVELTLRRYEKPTMGDRELVRKLCLSLGLLQPGDSRDVIVDIFYILLKYWFYWINNFDIFITYLVFKIFLLFSRTSSK